MTGSHFRAAAARAALAASLLVLSSCRGEPVEQLETEAPVPVVVETAKVDVIRAVIEATGVVTPAPGAELTVVAPEAARVVSIPKAEGDVVKTGDLLVQFEIPTLAADLAGPPRRRGAGICAARRRNLESEPAEVPAEPGRSRAAGCGRRHAPAGRGDGGARTSQERRGCRRGTRGALVGTCDIPGRRGQTLP
jgi:hypothetical protein